MKLTIFTVYDSKVGAYMQPFFLRSAGEAVRAIKETVKDPNNDLAKWPEDYSLFELGTFCQETANLEFFVPKCIGSILNIMAMEDKRKQHVVVDDVQNPQEEVDVA